MRKPIDVCTIHTKKAGSGIGLSLCKQIMMLHKGNIHVHSMEGQGTNFLLQF
ncbi:MAG: ATP-binding protein [Chitinophagaceae bacterium]